MTRAIACACALVAACGSRSPHAPTAAATASSSSSSPPLPMLAALPPPLAIDTPRFASVVVCVRCHTAGATALRDGHGRDVSPIAELGASMMSLSARDPYYLAALRRELDANPAGRATIVPLCVRCHAPVGFAEATASGAPLGLDELVAGASAAAVLGRDGVGCAGCHALSPAGLGGDASFVGQQPLQLDRVSFGALPAPLLDAMVKMTNTRPEPSAHISQSALCASCHTVLVHALDANGASTGGEVAEQTTYLEWRDSAYQDEHAPGPHAATCQHCHMPATDDDGVPIATAYSTRPPTSPVRAAFARHDVHGGNAYLLGRLAAHPGWLDGADPRPAITGAPTPAALQAAAAATEAFLATAARVEVAPARDGVLVTVVNLTGHKLPTGYPTRRMWLHVLARDAHGAVVLESGASKDGAIIDAHGGRLDGDGVVLPHRARIASGNDVAIWEAVAVAGGGLPHDGSAAEGRRGVVGANGARTHVLLGTAKLAKDDRILPAGWRADHPDAARTAPIGTADDNGFVPGQASVTIVLPASAATLEVELDYQAIPPETLSSYAPTDSKEAARFLAIADVAPAPQVIARAHWQR